MDFSSFSPDLLAFSKSRNPGKPPHLGTRYDRAGRFLLEPGNTIICHVTRGSKTMEALVEARETYLAMPEATQFAFTPVESLHMTLFQGIIEYRRRPAYWPSSVALDTPIAEMTEIMRERLARFEIREPFRVEVTGARPSGLLVDGKTSADRAAMRAWRDALAEWLGYRHPDHDTYPFHITFDYPIERLEDEALPRWQAMLDAVGGDLRGRLPVLELDPPAFCSFEDMKHFRELLVFDASP